MKQSFKLKQRKNSNIKTGDFVKLIDGSGLSCEESNEPVYIVYPYLNLTGSYENLNDMVAEVLETDIANYAMANGALGNGYVQDIKVRIGKAEFRTCSDFVAVVENIKEYTTEELAGLLGHPFIIKQ